MPNISKQLLTEAVELAHENLPVASIADKLSISPATLYYYFSQLRKLGVTIPVYKKSKGFTLEELADELKKK